MKNPKILAAFGFLVALGAIFINPAMAVSVAITPLFGISDRLSVEQIASMSPEQYVQFMSNRGKSDFSNYNGFDFEYFTGKNPSLEFNGGEGASLFSLDGAEPFSITIVNSKAAARTFYLSQGLLYTRGAETAGQLRTGTFAAINDTGADTSLTATTDNAISIEQFLAYVQKNPTYVPLIQATSSSATAQLATKWQKYRQGMIKNESPTVIPLRKYANGDQYNLQFQDFNEPIYLSDTDIVIVNVAASSSLTLDLYPLAARSSRKELANDVRAAKQIAQASPGLVVAQDAAFKNANTRG